MDKYGSEEEREAIWNHLTNQGETDILLEKRFVDAIDEAMEGDPLNIDREGLSRSIRY